METRRHGEIPFRAVTQTIYMPLMGEGTDCWRPVRAVRIDADIFEVPTIFRKMKAGLFRHFLACAAGTGPSPTVE
jgi:hypothetical protein